MRTKTRKQGVAVAAANQVRWSCRRPGSRTATSRPPPHLITTSLSRHPLRASPALFLTASSCLARSNRHSTTPTVQAPPFLPNPAPTPQEALKVDSEGGERSQARYSALHISHISLSFNHLFIYYVHSLVLCSVFTLVFIRGEFCLFISPILLSPSFHVFPVFFFVVNQSLRSTLCSLFYMWKIFSLLFKQIRLYLFWIFYVILLEIFPFPFLFLKSQTPFSSISTSEQKKQSIITPQLFAADWDPSKPIIVLLVLSLAASFVSGLWLLWTGGWGGQGQLSACLSTWPLPAPCLCLAVLALKGRRYSIGFTHQSLQFRSAPISWTWSNSYSSSVRTLLCL